MVQILSDTEKTVKWNKISWEIFIKFGNSKTWRPQGQFYGLCFSHYMQMTYRTYSNYSMVQNIIWKAACLSAFQKISCLLYGNRRLITVFTKSQHWNLSRANTIHIDPSMPIYLSPAYLRLGLPSGLSISGFPTKRI
jgi:hypothetical protein